MELNQSYGGAPGFTGNPWHWPPLKRLRRRIRTWTNERYWRRPAVQVPRPGSQRLIVCLTTSPKRIDGLQPVMASLLNQSVMPDEIHLNVPDVFARTGEPYVIPDWLIATPRVVLHRVSDIGPATKNVPTIERLEPGDDCIVITVDDDVRYLPRTIEVLASAVARQPSMAFGLSGYDLGPRWENRYSSVTGPVEVLEGWAGWAVHRRAIGRGTGHFFESCRSSRACFLHDDLVMANWLAQQSIPRIRLVDPRANTRMMKRRGAQLASGYEADALHKGAGGMAAGLDPRAVWQELDRGHRWRLRPRSPA